MKKSLSLLLFLALCLTTMAPASATELVSEPHPTLEAVVEEAEVVVDGEAVAEDIGRVLNLLNQRSPSKEPDIYNKTNYNFMHLFSF